MAIKLADKVVMRSTAALIPYASNARTHSDAQVAQIAASIREFGFTNPVLVDGEQGIIAGHGRILAARKLGIDQVPTIELAYLTESQRKAYVIADNKLAENAGWNTEMLSLELGDLKELGFDLSLTGFSDLELGSLLADKTEGLTDPDDAPAVPEHPVSEMGDLWILGRHRLLCGDSTVATDVERALGGVKPHLMVTDPPYGVMLDPSWRDRAGINTMGKAGPAASITWRLARQIRKHDGMQFGYLHRQMFSMSGALIAGWLMSTKLLLMRSSPLDKSSSGIRASLPAHGRTTGHRTSNAFTGSAKAKPRRGAARRDSLRFGGFRLRST